MGIGTRGRLDHSPLLAHVDGLGIRDRLSARSAGVALIGCGLLFFLSVNLTSWPSPWFDEGLNLSTAATLAEQGVYGLPDSAGVRTMDPAIQTGPTVVVPVAAAFELFGTGMTQARLVMVALALAAAAAYLLLVRRLAGYVGVLVAALFILIGTGDGFTSFIPLGRQMLGEVPALGLLCLGMLLLIRSMDGRDDHSPLLTAGGVGLVFGLAMVTKSQVSLTLPVALAAFGVVNALYYRLVWRWLPFLSIAVAVATVCAWYATQIFIVGIDGFQSNREVLSEGFGIHIAQFTLAGAETALRTLVTTGFVLWGVPALLYCARLARGRTTEGAMFCLLLLFTGAWLTWYVVLSIGWSRYAAIPLLLTPVFTARLVRDIAVARPGLRSARLDGRIMQVAGALVALGVGIAVLQTTVLAPLPSPADDHSRIIATLNQQVEPLTIVETWAWELDPFVDAALHHPQTTVTNAYTLLVWDGEPLPPGVYDPAGVAPDYVLENAFSTWTGIYADYVRNHGSLVAEHGEYRLYRVR